MIQNKSLSPIWLKASVLGCLWASSEIVLGSFMHNLKVPFGSNFLTAIGIILLIAVSYSWKDKGLFWRAGLICALMKSISPSAVIFGPMIAIFSEALLLELAILIFRRNIFAYVIGGMLAMSWTFFHKISFYIIAYGFNLIDLYKELAVFAQKQLKMHFDSIWSPIFALWSVYLLMGIVAALIAVYIGKKVATKMVLPQTIDVNKYKNINSKTKPAQIKTSIVWLVFDFTAMVAVLILMNFTDWGYWFTAGCLVIIIWVFQYKSALRPLMKPKFWATFILITMFTSFLFSKFQSGQINIYTGLMTGLEMNFRAVLIIIGFSVIGKELTNPRIRNLFTRTSFQQLPLALEVAFETLPFVIANMPDFKDFFKRPVFVVQQIVSQADIWLEKVSFKQRKKENVIIITGNIGQGKTTLLINIVNFFRQHKIRVGGIVSPVVIENNQSIGYDLIDISTGNKIVLSRTTVSEKMINVGKFYFNEEGITCGKKALSLETLKEAELIVIDEIGFMELENQGWASSLNNILNNFDKPIIIVVRNYLVEKVTEHWALSNPLIIETDNSNIDEIIAKIIAFAKINYVNF